MDTENKLSTSTNEQNTVIHNLQRRFGLKTDSESKHDELATKALERWRADANARRMIEMGWWKNDNFFRGQNFIFNKKTNQLEASKIQNKVFVNKARQQVRGAVSYLNKEHPFIHIQPGIQSDQAYSNAQNTQHLCSYWYDHLSMNAANKRITRTGMRFGLGWVKIMWDKEAAVDTRPFTVDGENRSKIPGDVTYDYVDTYDVYADPRMTSWADCRRITHVLPNTIGELKQNKKFHNALNLTPDDKLAASELKQSSLMRTGAMFNEQSVIDPDMRTVLLIEQFTKEFDYDSEQMRIRVTYTTPAGIYLYSDWWEMDEFPFEYYQSDIADTIYDSDGAVEHIRPLNESLNRSVSQMEDASDRMGKLHWVTEKGSGVNMIHDKTGTIIEVNQGKRFPEQARPVGVPSYVENHQANLERWIDDTGGIHDASYGKSPFSRASGEAIRGLQDGDNNSLAMYRDNFDDFLVRGFKKMLRTEKHFRGKQKVARAIRMKDVDPLGRYTWIDIKPENISLDDEVQVRSGTNMPFSNQAKQEMIINFYKEGLLNGTPQANAALKLLSLPEIENVQGNDQPHIERQSKELSDMVANKPVDDPIIAENHQVHIQVVDQFVNSPAWYKTPTAVRRDIMDHRKKHVQMSLELSRIQAANNLEPIKRSETLMVRASSLSEFTNVEATQMMSKFGVDSDRDEIQVRGGITVQKPEDALQQADIENMLISQGGSPRVSPTDNHQVHIEGHNVLSMSEDFNKLPKSSQKMLQSHIQQHEQMIQYQSQTPGLLNTPDVPVKAPDHTILTAGEKVRLREGKKVNPEAEAVAKQGAS